MSWPLLSYEEPVFRPPSEARSLILQLTVGCSWNRCKYCAMYRNKRFRVRDVAELANDIDTVGPYRNAVQRVFLADGDALAAPQEHLESVLQLLGERLPQLTRVGIYGDSRSILKLGVAGLAALARRGLGIVYFGAETGDDETLKAVLKGATRERQIEACRVVREAGLKLSVMVLLGLAGRDGSRRHAEATGSFLEVAAPSYAAALTVTPVPGTELFDAVQRGEFSLPDQWGMLRELLWMLERMAEYRGPFHANHASNYLPLKLRLPRDRAAAMARIRHVLETRDPSELTPEWMRGL